MKTKVSYFLVVLGILAFGSGIFVARVFAVSTAAVSNTFTFPNGIINTSGNVGIGTTNPVAADSAGRTLQIGNQTVFQSTVGYQSTISNNAYFDGSTWKYVVNGPVAAIRLNGLGNTGDIVFSTLGSGTAGGTAAMDASGPKMVILNGGNVGIGTTSPSYKLDVTGAIRTTSGGVIFPDGSTQTTAFLGGGAQTITAGNVSAGQFGSNTGGGNYTFPAAATFMGTGSGQINLNSVGTYYGNISTPSSQVWALGYSSGGTGIGTPVLAWNASGNVGIGTTAPNSQFDVAATNAVMSLSSGGNVDLYLKGSSSGNIIDSERTNNLYFQINGTTQMTLQGSNGNVGIGTASPGKKLDVQGGASFGSGTYQTGAIVDIGNTAVDYPGNSGWASTFNSNLLLTGLNYATISFHDSGYAVGDLGHVSNSFFFDGAGSWGPVSLGINTRSPGYTLDVQGGQINSSGGYCINGANCITSWPTGNAGTVTSVAAGSGLSGGTITTAGTISLNTGNANTWSAAQTFNGGFTVGGNISLTPANPYITSGGSYVVIPNGLYVSGGTPYFQTQIQARGGIHNDSATTLELDGGTSGGTYVNGTLAVGSSASVNQAGDIGVSRNASPTTGVIYLGSGGNHYLFFDGTNYQLPNGGLNLGGKLTVGTIDPVYSIGGTNYATYGPSMTGVNEETAGTLTLTRDNRADGAYSTTIDFGAQASGSSLWLFAHATALTDNGNLAKLVVILTPSFDGKVWYQKNVAAGTVTIYGDQAGEISYRFTAPRFDAAQWPNTAPASETANFTVK